MTARHLSPDDARDARVLRASGFTIADLADLYGLSPGSVSKLIHGRSYMDAGGPVQLSAPRKGVKLPAHGTPGRYSYHRCRCAACKAANAERCRKWRHGE